MSFTLWALFGTGASITRRNYWQRTIAFPAISCGVYGYPINEACQIAVTVVQHFLRQDKRLEKVIFSCLNNSVKKALLHAVSTR
jgi:O-acetyl-ADP-ribose deacetylase (regulator of RNase III)